MDLGMRNRILKVLYGLSLRHQTWELSQPTGSQKPRLCSTWAILSGSGPDKYFGGYATLRTWYSECIALLCPGLRTNISTAAKMQSKIVGSNHFLRSNSWNPLFVVREGFLVNLSLIHI